MDIGRIEFLIRYGMLKYLLSEKISSVAGGVNIVFFKALNPFDRYQLHTSIASWDEHWFYLKQDFVKDDKIMARAIAKVTFLKNGKKINTDDFLSKLNHNELKPEYPDYLTDMLAGEKILINGVKETNKAKS
jgi:acyl-CoA thioesterase FadM